MPEFHSFMSLLLTYTINTVLKFQEVSFMVNLKVVKVLTKGKKAVAYEVVSSQETYVIPRDMLIKELQGSNLNVTYTNATLYMRGDKPCIKVSGNVPKEEYKSDNFDLSIPKYNIVPYDSEKPFIDFVLDVIEANEEVFMQMSRSERRELILDMRFM